MEVEVDRSDTTESDAGAAADIGPLEDHVSRHGPLLMQWGNREKSEPSYLQGSYQGLARGTS